MTHIKKRDSFGLQNTKQYSMTYIDRAKRIVTKYLKNLSLLACFIQGESSGDRQISKTCELLFAQGRNVKIACIPLFL